MPSLADAVVIVTRAVHKFTEAAKMAASATREATEARAAYNDEVAKSGSSMTAGDYSGSAARGSSSSGSGTSGGTMTGGNQIATAIVTELQRRAGK